VGPRAGLDGWGKSRPHRDSISGPSSPKRVVILITLSGSISIIGEGGNVYLLYSFTSVLGHIKPNMQLLTGAQLSVQEGNKKYSPGAKLEILVNVPTCDGY
jgi:hypothetical protein